MVIASGFFGLTISESIGIIAMLVVVVFFAGYLHGTILAQRDDS